MTVNSADTEVIVLWAATERENRSLNHLRFTYTSIWVSYKTDFGMTMLDYISYKCEICNEMTGPPSHGIWYAHNLLATHCDTIEHIENYTKYRLQQEEGQS